MVRRTAPRTTLHANFTGSLLPLRSTAVDRSAEMLVVLRKPAPVNRQPGLARLSDLGCADVCVNFGASFDPLRGVQAKRPDRRARAARHGGAARAVGTPESSASGQSGSCRRDRAGQPGGALGESVCPVVLSDATEEVAVMVQVA